MVGAVQIKNKQDLYSGFKINNLTRCAIKNQK